MNKMLSEIGEFGLIELIRKKAGRNRSVPVGIGDDAALISRFSGNTLLTTDLIVEHVDFSFKTATPKQVGWKALGINLSDVAAMGGKPKAAVVGLVMPKNAALKTVKD